MTIVDHKYGNKQVKMFYTNALKDMKRSFEYDDPDVRFRFAYDALIKLAITVAASRGKRVLSRAGHHIELLSMLSDALGEGRVKTIGNRMRKSRNKDMYAGGTLMSEKAAAEYAEFVKDVFSKAEIFMDKRKGRKKLL